ncbi:MAG TPA: polynucleotide adenylyltransferase PcnB, partial [Pseudoxanthomonas sp.]|nr:polynucleotide adenylyltransferase PcnB [Pseudoxanthomonas sp.]
FRLLAHPRFRAAYDFLVLRQAASDSHAADVEFWKQAQQASGDELSANLEATAAGGGDPGEDVPPQRRRRRRRRASARPG